MDRRATPCSLPFEELGTAITTVGFGLLFPGFFLYHFAASAGLFPRFLGGWFGPVSVVILAAFSVLLILAPWRLRGRSLFVFLLFAILILSVLGWLAAHHVLGAGYQGDGVIQRQVLALVALWLTLFMMGLYWPEDSSLLTRILAIALPVMVGLTVLNADFESLLFSLAYQNTGQENVTTYQGFARSLAITAIVLLSIRSDSRLLLPAVFATAVGLFLIGARSELYSFAMVSPLLAWYGYESRRRFTLLVTGAGAILLTTLVVSNWETLTSTRPLQVLTSLEEIGSFQQRRAFLIGGLRDITSRLLTGVYAGQYAQFGSSGAYIHNILSAWRQFGVGVFLLYAGLTVPSSIVSLRYLLRDEAPSELWRVSLAFNVFATVLVLASKPVFWPFPALGWGLVASGLLRSRS